MNFARIALAAAAAAILSASAAGAQGGQIQAGVCRAATCPCTQEQLDRGMVTTPQGCTACDEAARDAAKEEFYKWWRISQIHEAQITAMTAEAKARNDEVLEIYHSFFGKQAFEWVKSKIWGKVPEPVRTSTQAGIGVYTAETPEDVLKTSLDVAKGMSDHLKDKASWAKTGSDAFKKTNWVAPVIDLGLVAGKMDLKYQEAERADAQGARAAAAYQEYMEKAFEAQEKWDALRYACLGVAPPAQAPPAEPGPGDMGPDRADLQTAKEIQETWNRLGRHFSEALVAAREAFLDGLDRALRIIGVGGPNGGPDARAPDEVVRLATAVSLMPNRDEFTPAEVDAFVTHMTWGLGRLARMLELQLLINAEIAKLTRLTGIATLTASGFPVKGSAGLSPASIAHLADLIGDSDAAVRAAAGGALARAGGPAVPALLMALTDSAAAEPLRAAARSALVQIGKALGTGLTVEAGEGLAQPFSWSIVPAGASPAAFVVSSRGADGGLQSVPPGRYDIYWAPEYAHRDEPTLIAGGVEVTDSQPLSLRMGPALRMERAEWVPRLDGSGWWGVVPAGVAPSERTSWTNGHDALALPTGRYDVYWVQGYAQRDRPLLLAAGVAVAAGRPTVIPAAAGIRLTFRGDPPTVASSGWWGAVPVGGDPADPINWSAGRLDLPILLPPGTYDVYWKAGYGAEPELKSARVAVGANRLVLIDWETGRTRSVAGAGDAAASTPPARRGLALLLAGAFGVLGAGGVLVVRLRSRLFRPGVM